MVKNIPNYYPASVNKIWAIFIRQCQGEIGYLLEKTFRLFMLKNWNSKKHKKKHKKKSGL